MKYIRTWYGKLFGVAGLSKTGKSVLYISKKSGKQCQMPRNSGDRISDTIEELCDGLIVEEKGNESNWFIMSIRDLQNLSDQDKEYQLKDWAFYAFIKTRKGLIYVAKMNEEGDLELL